MGERGAGHEAALQHRLPAQFVDVVRGVVSTHLVTLSLRR